MSTRETLRDPNNGFRIMGFIDTEDNGDKTALNYFFQPLGFYTKSTNVTKDIHFGPITIGDNTWNLVTQAYYELLRKEKDRYKK